ncbi:hypothetical protein DFJ74DRAFT_288412 [Hyaloraphidium curvatum]|nr:hypothetical protein DFJ74DRAFT_288412 [Hyaloraphidium curvatum]
MSSPSAPAMGFARAPSIRGPLPATPGAPGRNPTGISAFANDGFSAGIWESDPYKVDLDGYPVTEAMHILEGEIVVTPKGGQPESFGPGDYFVLPKGWVGRFEVTKKVRKVYAISKL